MKRKVTKRDEPSKASLREMPEIDPARFAKARRNPYAERLRKSVDFIMLDKKTVAKLGGPTAVIRILQALADSLEPRRRKHHAA